MADETMEVDAPKLNIAAAIGEKLTESIKNLDVMSMIKRMIEQVPEDEEAEGVQEKLKGVLDQYNAMSDEEREEFASKMKETLASKLALKLKDSAFDMSGIETAIQDAIRFHIMLVGGGIILFVILLGMLYASDFGVLSKTR